MGDFLIYERTKALLRQHKGMEAPVELHSRSESLDTYLDRVNATKAVIICGGPGTMSNMYPGTYPLATNLDDIKVPIIILGSGWYGIPGDDATIAQYSFTATAMGLFERIRCQGHMISVRDYLTEHVLQNSGITNVVMTGCPSWYDLQHLDANFEAPDSIRTVVFTPPAQGIFRHQAVDVMEMLRGLFPDARLICSFHRGIEPDEQTPQKEAQWMGELAQAARDRGFEVIDASYGLENVGFYDDCDLHVGYRVHGHIHFLGQRKPSFLIHEDGRGRGASEALGLPGIQGWVRTVAGKAAAKTKQPQFSAFLDKRDMAIHGRQSVAGEVERYIKEEMESGFARFSGLSQTIRQHYRSMVGFLETIP